ncbi:SANT/Myb domain [Dillenia turbinata]|uniref:SANT/Myb domain n=1 Tax=Dillenia turbinata TaxID=194707 RepID=A0AAN8VI91_9MAGN
MVVVLMCSHVIIFENYGYDHLDGDGEDSFSKSHDIGRFTFDSLTEVSNGVDKEFETSDPDSISSFYWPTGCTFGKDGELEEGFNMSFFPSLFESDLYGRPLVEFDELRSPISDSHDRKSVPVGPDHQAFVPEWIGDYVKKSDSPSVYFASLSFGIPDANEYVRKWMGTCILPLPALESSVDGCCLNRVRNCCCCIDLGSIRCVRQHITEARKKLRESLGKDIFQVLGFSDMGEEVAREWSEEEEEIFHEVVMSYPASMGKNFWDHLPIMFPSRTRKELVSYYFNVYMLRKRAKQNRVEPLNIDSDDDEWQGSELGTEEEDENSIMLCPHDQEVPAYSQDASDEIVYNAKGYTGSRKLIGGADGRCTDDVTEFSSGNFTGDWSPDMNFELSGDFPGTKNEDDKQENDG